MRKLAFTCLLFVFALSTFGQVSKSSVKVITMFWAEKHPEFDESKFPNIEFYYVIKNKYKNPEGMLEKLDPGTGLLFDKNGVLISEISYDSNNGGKSLGEQYAHCVRKKVVQEGGDVFDCTTLEDFGKTYVKKGKVMKDAGKIKSKHPERYSEDYVSHKFPDFKVVDSKGKEYSFNSIIGGQPLTIVQFMYFDSWNSPLEKYYSEQVEKLVNTNKALN